MQSNNPVFNREEAFSRLGYAGFREEAPAPSAQVLEDMYSQPSATPVRTGRMTYDDVVVKTGMTFAVLLAGATVGWFNPGLWMVGLIVGLVLGLVNAFKREPSPALILAYAAFEGLALGGISVFYEATWDNIVPQAVLGTFAVFLAALVAYRSGRIRVTPKFQRILLIALGGYLVFSVVNLVAMLFGFGGPWGFRSGAIGVVIGVFAVGLGALFLVLDFDFIAQGVRNGIPERYSWTAAFGLTVTLVWIYLEMLRLIAILRGDG